MQSTLSKDVLNKYRNHIFFETGTSWGAGVQLALDCGFQKIYTCELSFAKIGFNKIQFAKQIDSGTVRIIEGDTTDTFADAIKLIDSPATFWLDAHWDDGPMGKCRCPLPFELEAIAQHPIKDHTLLIDDRRLFGTADHTWGWEVSEQKILDLILKINPDYKISYEDGFIPNDIIVARV